MEEVVVLRERERERERENVCVCVYKIYILHASPPSQTTSMNPYITLPSRFLSPKVVIVVVVVVVIVVVVVVVVVIIDIEPSIVYH